MGSRQLDVPQKIILGLKKADRPLICQHIAKGIKESSQLTYYHLKKLVDMGVVLTTEEFETTYYFLQPYFYQEEPMTALISVLTPFVKSFAEETEIPEDLKREDVVGSNLYHYLNIFIEFELKEILQNHKNNLKTP